MRSYLITIVVVVMATLVCVASQALASDDISGTWAPSPLAIQPEYQEQLSFSQAADIGVCGPSSPAQQVVELTNIARFENGGLPPLKMVEELDVSSYIHSINMAERNFFAHCDLDTKKAPWDRMTDAGYYWNWAGENIAAGYSSPAAVMTGWMNSSGHRANILDGEFREIGVGYYYYADDRPDTRRDLNGDCDADSQANGSYYRYWTQNFGKRNSVYPVVINLEAHMTDSLDVGLYVYGEGWASEMRIRNNQGNWSAWLPYSSEQVWSLEIGNGPQTVTVEIRNAYGTIRSTSDEICLEFDDPVILPDLIFKDGFE